MEPQRVQESISKFEQVVEFREVKLKTRQSFREDQAALDSRISDYRSRVRSRAGSSQTMSTDDEAEDGSACGSRRSSGADIVDNGSVGVGGVGVDSGQHSKLEDIVLDIQHERGESETDYPDTSVSETGDVIVARERVDVSVENTRRTNGINMNGETDKPKMNGESDKPKVNGEIDATYQNGGIDTHKLNGHATRESGHGEPVYQNTHIPNGRPNSAGHMGPGRPLLGSMTPEPRLKTSGKRIYEKNPKLTAASTEHLDNISLRGFKTSPAHGLRLVEIKQQHQPPQPQQQHVVPPVPGLPVSSIPADGNLREFNVDEMVTIFRMLNVDDDLLLRFSVNKVDGKRFSTLSDKDLQTLGICNPIIRYFRDRSSAPHRRKKGIPFML